jgi:hypothetical protein
VLLRRTVERVARGMSNTFVAVYRDRTGTKHDVQFKSLDDAVAFLRAHLERIRDAVAGEVHEYETKHSKPRTLAECHDTTLVARFTLGDVAQP